MSTIDRGAHAQRLLTDPVLTEAFDAVRDQALRDFETAENPGEAWEARNALHALRMVKAWLFLAVKSGEAEMTRITEEERDMRREAQRQTVPPYDMAAARAAREMAASPPPTNEKVGDA